MPGPEREQRASISRSIGRFFGEITKAVRTPADQPDTKQISRRTETEERDTPQGKVTLRRTIIEEVDLHRLPEPAPVDDAAAQPPTGDPETEQATGPGAGPEARPGGGPEAGPEARPGGGPEAGAGEEPPSARDR
jgi:hypothetical protein